MIRYVEKLNITRIFVDCITALVIKKRVISKLITLCRYKNTVKVLSEILKMLWRVS